MNIKALIAAGALLATQSFAIIGVGGHYAPGFGTSMDASAREDVANGVQFSHGDFDGTMQGFGFKLWIDILPFIDVEATMNFQMGSYDASLYVLQADASLDGDPLYKEVPLEIELGGTPFGKATPKFVAMTGDISITYPITFLPIIRPYIGGGLSMHFNTFVLNKDFVSKVLDGSEDLVTALANDIIKDPTLIADAQALAEKRSKELKEKVQEAALEEGLKKSVGGHILLGVRAKFPIIPIAAYANGKYYIGGDYPSEIDPGNITVELGLGFAL